MKCDEIRDLIITDYVDDEADAKTRSEIELHLGYCAACRSFKEALLLYAVEPLKNAAAVNPPETLWYRVRSGIERVRNDGSSFDIGTVISAFLPKWANVAVFASLVLFTFLAGNYFAHNIWVKQYAQASYTVSSEENDSLALGELSDIPSEQVKKVYSDIIGG